MSDKKEYESLLIQQKEIEQALKNRCIECVNYNKKNGECLKHGFVPVEFIYQKNDCDGFDYLPF